ncbi:MAG: ComEA family DNA-binding protein [Clostridia bacterium]|nr:ComEA family DNA-binding protein [Clostridia bacterium]
MDSRFAKAVLQILAVSLISGILALFACYTIVKTVSGRQMDVYPSFADDGTQPIVRSEVFPHGPIDPNTASVRELMQIPGIGQKTAEAIVAEREQNGPFLFPEDLMSVKGIGPKKLESFLPYFCFPD